MSATDTLNLSTNWKNQYYVFMTSLAATRGRLSIEWGEITPHFTLNATFCFSNIILNGLRGDIFKFVIKALITYTHS